MRAKKKNKDEEKAEIKEEGRTKNRRTKMHHTEMKKRKMRTKK